MKLGSLLNEASEIQIGDLSASEKKLVDTLNKIIGGKSIILWDGIHGKIVDIEPKNMVFTPAYRFTSDQLKKLAKLNIRWIDGGQEHVSIGF